MLAYERQHNILTYLERKQSASIRELAKAVYASEASVRRDVERLEAEGHVERIYGGVLLAKYKNSVIPVGLRDSSNSAGKEIAAQKASRLINDGDTIIMDASTTVFRICKYIKDRKHLKIITNNLRVCQEFSDIPEVQVYCTGGFFVGSSGCFLGSGAEQYITGIHADILFFSAQGIDSHGMITDVSEQEIAMRRVMLKHARRRYFVCDGSKFGVIKPFILCDAAELDDLISDTELVIEK